MKLPWQRVEELEDRDGVLYFDGCSVPELARTFGTPTYVYSESRLRQNYRRLRDAVRTHYDGYEIYYALKVNGNPALVEVLRSEGAGADCATLQEVEIARHAGVPAERILFTGAFISRDELARAVQLGIQINLAELCHLEELATIGPPRLLSIRVNPGEALDVADCEFKLGGAGAKFGVPLEQAIAAYARARQLGVTRFGIHAMAGSNVLEVDYFVRLLELVCEAARTVTERTGIELEFVNLGGSLGIPYRDEQKALDVAEMGRRLGAVMRARMPGARLRLIQEPGRYLAGDAGVLVTRVTSTKRDAEAFIGVDAGMNTLVRPAMYDAYHRVLWADDLRAPGDTPTHVVGQICESRDVLARSRPLSAAIKPGHVLAVLDAGAYGYAMSSRFHAKLPAAEVMVRAGAAELVRERPELPEVLAGTRRPSWLTREPARQVG